jgi:hypothetical protein
MHPGEAASSQAVKRSRHWKLQFDKYINPQPKNRAMLYRGRGGKYPLILDGGEWSNSRADCL